jgi:hypothetical protein
VKGDWCLAIRTVSGNNADPEGETQEMWPLNEAPRYLRVKAVNRLPDLIKALVEATNATTSAWRKRMTNANRDSAGEATASRACDRQFVALAALWTE